MSSELERQLERALGEAPGPDPGVTDRALQSALEALPSPADARRIRRRRIVLLLAACIAAFVSGGVTLAATDGRLPGIGPALTSGRPAASGAPAHPNAPLVAPGEVISALIGDHGLVVTAHRARTFTDHHLTGFAASPAALYAIEARAGHLRAVQAATGRVAWRFGVGGTPTNPVWAPFPIRVVYLLHGRGGLEVHDIWGNGTHDFTVHASAAPVAPSWRWDSKAFAFVRGDGAVVVHDVIGGRDVALRPACGLRTAAAVAFAPSGGRLAIADRDGHLRVVDTTGHAPALCTTIARGLPSIGWLGGTPAPRRGRQHPFADRDPPRRHGIRRDHHAWHDRRPRSLARRPPGRAGTRFRRPAARRNRNDAPVQRGSRPAPHPAHAGGWARRRPRACPAQLALTEAGTTSSGSRTAPMNVLP